MQCPVLDFEWPDECDDLLSRHIDKPRLSLEKDSDEW